MGPTVAKAMVDKRKGRREDFNAKGARSATGSQTKTQQGRIESVVGSSPRRGKRGSVRGNLRFGGLKTAFWGSKMAKTAAKRPENAINSQKQPCVTTKYAKITKIGQNG
jgi:hypothetical protein